MIVSTHLVPRWIRSGFPTGPTYLMSPLVEARGLLEREVPPDILDGAVPRNLLPSRYETGDVVGIYMVALIVGDGVHSGKSVERWRREG